MSHQEFKLACAPNAHLLEQEVNKLLKEQWSLHGYPFRTGEYTLNQALVRAVRSEQRPVIPQPKR